MKQQILVTLGLTLVCFGLWASGIDELGGVGIIIAFFTSFSWIDIYNEHKSKQSN